MCDRGNVRWILSQAVFSKVSKVDSSCWVLWELFSQGLKAESCFYLASGAFPEILLHKCCRKTHSLPWWILTFADWHHWVTSLTYSLQDASMQPWIPLTQPFCCLVFLGLIFGGPCDGGREASRFAYGILMCKCPLNLLACGWKVYFTRGDHRGLSIRSGERNPTEVLTSLPGPLLDKEKDTERIMWQTSNLILKASLIELLTSMDISLENWSGSLVFSMNFVSSASSLNHLVTEPEISH